MEPDEYLGIELKYKQSSFNKMNGYPHWVIFSVFKEIKGNQLNKKSIAQKPNEDHKNKVFSFVGDQ